jgi:predicted transcriptional regulator
MAKRTGPPDANDPGSARDLPDAELEVLACLWQHGEATARALREQMQAYRPMAHGSMVTLLTRLERKGLVSKRKGQAGKAFIYTPTRRPEPTYRRIMRDIQDRIFGGSGVTMVSSLFESRPPTEDELDQLQHLLDDLRRRNAGREHDQ